MTIRMTMTAVALGTMTLAGCSSMNGGDKMMSKPVVAAPGPAAAPAGTAPALTGAPNRAADAGTLPGGTAASQSALSPAASVEVDRVSGNGSSGDPFTTEFITTTSGGTPDAGSAMTSPTAIEGPAQIQREADFSDAARMERMKDDDAMTADADMTAEDMVMNNCFKAGGQVVSWVGDPSGATQACRQEDGLEYRLADAQYYQ